MTTEPQQAQPILVVGSTGKTGRRVAERLNARGLDVRAGSRSAASPFDWEDDSTWLPALSGTSAAYVSYFPDVATPGAPEAIAAFTETALDAGTSRLVLISGRGEEEAQRAEDVLRESGADWTVVRCSFFMQNFSESYFRDPLVAGELALPTDGVAEPFVDAEDIADVAVAALTEDGHSGQLYELTGPRMLTFAEAVAEIGRCLGRDLDYVSIPIEDFTAGLSAEGVPPEVVSLLGYIFTEVLDGRNAQLADGVQRALGREPRDFSEFAREAAAAGAWGAPR